jgi:transcriptional regulator with GAF, ATPase, and Fis domain
VGLFEKADGATIFLDEIGDMPLEMQGKLLRVLQAGEVKPVGDVVTRKVRVRVIAATNRDLGKALAGSEFREDLFYRFNAFTVIRPPLRERSEDIPGAQAPLRW